MSNSAVCNYLSTTVGKKFVMALTCLGLSGFVLSHMAGNMLILVSPEAYNKYGHAIITNPLLIVAELGLVAMFLTHMALAFQLTARNMQARPVDYAIKKYCDDKGTDVAARSMILSGLLVLVFLVLHLITFKYGAHYTVTYGTTEMRDLHKLIVEEFKKPGYLAWYVFSLVVLGMHLNHGISAALQTLGLASNTECRVRCAGRVIAWTIILGFISQPLYCFFAV